MEGAAVVSTDTGLCLAAYETSKGKSLNVHLDESEVNAKDDSLFSASSLATFMHLVNLNAQETFGNAGSIRCWIRQTDVKDRGRTIAIGVHDELKVAVLLVTSSTIGQLLGSKLANVLTEEVAFWHTHVHKENPNLTLSKHLKTYIRHTLMERAIDCIFQCIVKQIKSEEICEAADWIQLMLSEKPSGEFKANRQAIKTSSPIQKLLCCCGPTKIHPVSIPIDVKTYFSHLSRENAATASQMDSEKLMPLQQYLTQWEGYTFIKSAARLLERSKKSGGTSSNLSAMRLRFKTKDGARRSMTSIKIEDLQAVISLQQDQSKAEEVESRLHLFNYDILVGEYCGDAIMKLTCLKNSLSQNRELARSPSNDS